MGLCRNMKKNRGTDGISTHTPVYCIIPDERDEGDR